MTSNLAYCIVYISLFYLKPSLLQRNQNVQNESKLGIPLQESPLPFPLFFPLIRQAPGSGQRHPWPAARVQGQVRGHGRRVPEDEGEDGDAQHHPGRHARELIIFDDLSWICILYWSMSAIVLICVYQPCVLWCQNVAWATILWSIPYLYIQ